LTETVDSTATSPDDANPDEREPKAEEQEAKADEQQAKSGEQEKDRSVTELLEQLGRDLSGLALREAELETARHSAEVKLAARKLCVVGVIGVGFLAAFAFLNVAAFSGLSTSLSPWLSALVLAAVWLVIGGLASVVVVTHVRRSPLWRVLMARPADAIDELERTRKEAAEAARETLGQLGPALSIEIASAAIPSASGIAGGVVGAGEGLLEASDEIVDSIIDELPAGSVVNQIWDVALMPGRFGLRVATTVLKRESVEE
jgi:hypothetical protein